MATKIQVEVNKQQAVSDLKEIEKGVKDVGAAAVQASQQVAGTQKVASDAAKAAANAGKESGGKSALESADELIAKMDELDAASAAASAASGTGWGKVGIAIAGVVGAVAAAKAAISAFNSTVKTAAASGNVEAQRLSKSFDSIGDAWDGATNRIANTGFFKSLMDNVREATKEVSTLTSAIGFLFAGDDGGAGEKQNRLFKQAEEKGKILADLEKDRFQERERNAAKELKTAEQVNAAIAEQQQAMDKLLAAGMFEGQLKEKAAIKLQVLTQRLRQMDNEAANEREANDRKAIQDAERLAEARKRAAADASDFLNDAHQDMLDNRREREDEQRADAAEKDGKLIDELKRQEAQAEQERGSAFRKAMQARENVSKGTTKEEIDGLDRIRRAAEQDYDRAASAAEQAANRRINAERAAEAEAEQARKKKVDEAKDDMQPFAQQIQQRAQDPRALIKQLADARAKAMQEHFQKQVGEGPLTPEMLKEVDEVRRNAHKAAYNQSRGGPMAFGQKEIADAQQQLASQMVQGLGQSANLGSENLEALGSVTKELINTSNDVNQMRQQVQALQKQINLLSGHNAKHRAQAGGSRP